MEDLLRFLVKLVRERFYGSVEVKFEAGRVVLVRVNRTIKPEELGSD